MRIFPGAPMIRAGAPAPKPHPRAPKPAKVFPGSPMIPAAHAAHPKKTQSRPKLLPGAPKVFPGAPMIPAHAAHAKKAKKARGLARSATAVACCAAEALAASLRLAGGAVSDEDVLALHWLAGGDVDVPVSIWAALEGAAGYGLAGARPRFEMVSPCAPAVRWPGSSALCLRGLTAYPGGGAGGLILGVELPGPHALYDDGTAWWSWGEPFDPASFPGAVIEEAWAVRWN